LALTHELTVTSQINKLVELAMKESDHITDNMLAWFVKEQLEEVSSMDNLLKVVQRAGESNLIHVEDYLTRLHGKTARIAAEAKDET
jgi:bacterioferritin B